MRLIIFFIVIFRKKIILLKWKNHNFLFAFLFQSILSQAQDLQFLTQRAQAMWWSLVRLHRITNLLPQLMDWDCVWYVVVMSRNYNEDPVHSKTLFTSNLDGSTSENDWCCIKALRPNAALWDWKILCCCSLCTGFKGFSIKSVRDPEAPKPDQWAWLWMKADFLRKNSEEIGLNLCERLRHCWWIWNSEWISELHGIPSS